jgi:ABC-type polysaccharide/polyol phosphate transport system ATPase subunit
MTLIRLDDVSLVFHVRHHGRISLKEYLLNGFCFRRKVNSFTINALEHIDLSVGEGDRLGIIGPNGAGKSALLKLLAGVYPPSGGRRQVFGRVSALFDIALGFEMDASGWENIAYRGYLQGETPSSIKSKMQPIAEFSELGEFLDMPVRYYSSGMLVRLAFSIATAVDPEILLVDEVLAAGDAAFQAKAHQRMRALISRARAVIIVSHNIELLRQLCDRILWLDHGRIRAAGPADEVIQAYLQQSAQDAARQAA